MKKSKRISLFLSVDADIYAEFECIVKKKFINKSLLIDNLIKEWIKNNNYNK